MSAAASSGAPHDAIKAVQGYVNRILKPKDKSKEVLGMKCLLLDKETVRAFCASCACSRQRGLRRTHHRLTPQLFPLQNTPRGRAQKGIVGMVYSMNDILARDVFLVEALDGDHDRASTAHLKAVCLLRPTPDNVRALVGHLREPRFLEYHLFFTNVVPQDLMRKVADADHLGVVKSVQEAYADFYAVNPDAFSLNLGGTLALSRPKAGYSGPEEALLKRSAASLLAVLLAFKLKPYVRYCAASDACAALAREVTGAIGGERELFTFQRTGGVPLLLILDRREDAVTPLLTQWTYQAMVHEVLPGGIRNNRVDLSHVKGVAKDLEEVVLSPADDAFFAAHAFSNYGDTGEGVKAMLD